MRNRIKVGYALGHMPCDITIGLYGTYLLLFMNKVVGLDPIRCGVVLTVNSFLDALSVLLIGFIIDRFFPFSGNIDSKKFWHLVGCLTVPLLLPLHFIPPPGYDNDNINQNETLGYFLVVAGLMPFAFAFLQLPHLIMVGKLASDDSENVTLQSIKNAITVLAIIVIHILATFLFAFDTGIEETNNTFNSTSSDFVSWEDQELFMYLGIGGAAFGFLSTMVFHSLVKSTDLNAKESRKPKSSSLISGFIWFKRIPFYSLMAFYSLTWSNFLLVQTYLPFYLQLTLGLDKKFVSIIPLVRSRVKTF